MIRLLTANLYSGRVRTDSLARILDEWNPDVVAAQELAPDTADVLSDRFGHGLLSPALDTHGVGLVARFPFTVRRLNLPHRDGMVGEGDFTVWSVHLANPVDFSPSLGARRAQVEVLAKAIGDPSTPTALVGDLNATPRWPAYKRLTRHLADGVAELAERNGGRPAPTWGYRPWLPALLRIDHVLVAHVKLLEARTLRLGGSDHRALLVDLDLP